MTGVQTCALPILGKIAEGDSLYTIAYKYVRNTNLFDVSFMQSGLTDAEKREHFILLHAWE